MSRQRAVGWALSVAGVVASATAGADDLLAKLSVHGFLSQAYGRADAASATSLGITTDGTTDYRTAALQLSYAVTEKDRLLFQLSHERIGVDPKAAFLSDVAFDWVFYERRFSDSTSVKVGRLPIPLGIYNEIRDVGTLLPFYRPPAQFYNETAFLSETLDGLLVSQSVQMGSWRLEVEPFVGSWNTLAISGSTPLQRARAENAVGVSSWLNTPVSGLRVGGAFFRSTLRRGVSPVMQPVASTPVPTPPPAPEPRRVWQGSLDGSFSRVTVQAEYSRATDGDSRDRVYYGLVSVKPMEKLSLNVQYSKQWVSWFAGRLQGVVSGGNRDLAVGVNYSFRPNLVVKLEGHDGEGFAARTDPPTNRYLLVSLAASF